MLIRGKVLTSKHRNNSQNNLYELHGTKGKREWNSVKDQKVLMNRSLIGET